MSAAGGTQGDDSRWGEYTQGFKETMAKKLAAGEARSATALAAQVGVPQSTLSRWVREYGSLAGNTVEGKMAKRGKQWGAEEKLRAGVALTS